MNITAKRLKYPQLVILIFALIILIGTILLMLPVSSRNEVYTPFIDALFTATSANCITGLVVYDTYSYWSIFGQVVILILIQFGGLGFMSIATIISLAVRRKIGLGERVLMKEAIGSSKLKGIVHMTKNLLLGTVFFEGLGTFILAFRFCPLMGFREGLYNALFHSISAFCNAGFDLFGKYKSFSSLTAFSRDPVVCMTLASLIVTGGIGFLVWENIIDYGLKFKKYTLHTKIVMETTVTLIILSAVLFYFIETDKSMVGMSIEEKISNSLFQAITPRTAGFNTLDLTAMSDASVFLTILLMFIGGSPGSTAGGIKTTVFFLLFAAVWSSLRGKKDIEVFKKRIDDSLFKKASTLAILYLSVAMVSIVLVLLFQDFQLSDVIFEVFSAIGTVGLTLGITPSLNVASKIVIILLMYLGRVGVFSIMFTFSHHIKDVPVRYPAEDINIA